MSAATLIFVTLLHQNVLVVPDPATPAVPTAWVDHARIDDETDVEAIQRAIITTLEERGIWVRSVRAITPGPDGRWVPLPALLPPITPPPRRATEAPAKTTGNNAAAQAGPGHAPALRVGPEQAFGPGGLAGKSLYVSQSHGWYWSANLGRWASQRPNTNNIIEDFVGAEGIDHYLIPLLLRAGATVFPVREPDRQAALVMADDTDATLTGAWTPGGAGIGPAGLALQSGQNPFETGQSQQTLTVAGAATATATFDGDVPQDGRYGVNLAYVAGPDRAADVQVQIHHAGGVATFEVDQRRHGATWLYLGRFRFRQGQARVVITNRSATPNRVVSIDAVRFGGGMGLVSRGNGSPPAAGPTTGRPRWESCSRYHIQFCGAPSAVYNPSSGDNKDDVTARSRYAAWQHEDGEDAAFVSWHSNAPNPGRGTSTWVYGPDGPGSAYQFTGTAGSEALAQAVHGELIGAIKAEWAPDWKDRGIHSAWFGELNPYHNPEMPSILVETAFHDTEADAVLLAEPRFRYTLARAYYHGIVRYFAERDGLVPQFLPEPPRRLSVMGQPDGTVRVRWAAPNTGQAATGYRIYTSKDGFGFGLKTTTPSGEATDVILDDLEPGTPVFVSVTATNPGGESFATPVLGAVASCDPKSARALVVQGFNRLDRFLLPRPDMTAWSLGWPMRLDQDVVNTFDYTVDHGLALWAASLPFDSVEAAVVEAGLVEAAGGGANGNDAGNPLLGRPVVDWILGEESTADETFSAAEQAQVDAYLAAGGRLIATGAELLWDLDEQGDAADKAFAHDRLKASFVSDDAETYTLAGGASFTAHFDVDFPDVLAPAAGANVLWTYDGGQVAAISYLGDDFGVVTAGFPLEAIAGANDQADLMAQALAALAVTGGANLCEPVEPPDPGPTVTEPSPTADGALAADTVEGPEPDAQAEPTAQAEPDLEADTATIEGDGGSIDSGHAAPTPPNITFGFAQRPIEADGCSAGGRPTQRPGGLVLLWIGLLLAIGKTAVVVNREPDR